MKSHRLPLAKGRPFFQTHISSAESSRRLAPGTRMRQRLLLCVWLCALVAQAAASALSVGARGGEPGSKAPSNEAQLSVANSDEYSASGAARTLLQINASR